MSTSEHPPIPQSAGDEGPFDGRLVVYHFGVSGGGRATWKVEATSLRKAIRAFRLGALYPHQYSTKPIATQYGEAYNDKVYLSSEPGAAIPVYAVRPRKWEHVADISPTQEDTEMMPALHAAQGHLRSAGIGSDTTAIAVGDTLTMVAALPRAGLEELDFDLQKKMADLEAAKRELSIQAGRIREELKRRLEQVWMIELFLGSKEEVRILRRGEPAPADTPITVRQQILCMDEEIAVYDWFNNPDRIGNFDYQNLEDFDNWLLESPEHLDAIFPDLKGIVGLRVRRRTKSREYEGIRGAFVQLQEEEWDRMTYLLVRNGDNLYRLWVDVNLWPRLFSAEADIKMPTGPFRESQRRSQEALQKQFFAGMLVVQGLIERSNLLHPLPVADLSLMKVEHQGYFNLVRDGEGQKLLADPDNKFAHLTWKTYVAWLRSHLASGVRVLYTGPQRFGFSDSYDNLKTRTGLGTVASAPNPDEIYTLVEPTASKDMFEFLYLPDDYWSERQKRVRWTSYSDELVPVDMMSWRVLEHLIRDRHDRENYERFFTTAFHWWHQKKAEGERERPFVDLVLAQAGVDPTEANRARVERLVRWWKMKTKTHRTLGSDEAKALRMILKAFQKGEDFENDPERLLFREVLYSE